MCLLENLVLKGSYLHYSMVLEQIVELLVDPSLNPIFATLLACEFELSALAWPSLVCLPI